MQKIIDKVSEILEEYQGDRDKRGLDYNIFTLMDIERDEVTTHEHMIYTILNDRRNLNLREEIVESFLINMGLSKSFSNEKWDVERQYYTENNGIMDLFFRTSGHSKKCVVVELKVDAVDQPKQLKRYEEYVLENFYKGNSNRNHRIIYLTLDGRNPSGQSCEDMQYPKKLLRNSFGENLLPWLESCVEKCKEYDVDSSYIQQYKILVTKLTEEESMEKDIAGLIKSSEEMKACLALEKALPIIKGQILYKFMDTINVEMQKKGCEVLDENYAYEDDDCAVDYYDGRAHFPCFVYRIKEFTSRNKKVTLSLAVDVDTVGFEYYIGYFDECNKSINNEQFKKSNKRINQSVEEAIRNVFNIEIRNNSYNCIIYKYITDNQNNKYDFKHFSENCAELMDAKVLKEEARRIARNMAYYIKEIKAYLEEEEENG